MTLCSVLVRHNTVTTGDHCLYFLTRREVKKEDLSEGWVRHKREKRTVVKGKILVLVLNRKYTLETDKRKKRKRVFGDF